MRVRWALLAALSLGAPVQAGSDPTLGAGVVHRKLVEHADDGTQLLSESGPLLQLAVDKGWSFAGGGALHARGAIAGGGLDYRGRTQVGAPLATSTGHRDLEATLAWRPLPASEWGEGWLVLHAVAQRRQIASTPRAVGLRETMRLLMPGVRWTHVFQAGGWRYAPSVELRVSAWQQLDVEARGTFDRVRMEDGRRREAVLGVDVLAADSPWSWRIELAHARQSGSARETLLRNGSPAGTVRHPRLRITDVAVEFRRAF